MRTQGLCTNKKQRSESGTKNNVGETSNFWTPGLNYELKDGILHVINIPKNVDCEFKK